MTVMMDAFAVRGRSPQGERGLKLRIERRSQTGGGRSPQGERGLKSRVEVEITEVSGLDLRR